MCAISGRHNGDHELDQRYYGAGTGRFGSPDPGGISTALLKDPGSWNRYAYGGGDPVNRIDPTGTTWMCVGYNDDFSCYDDGSGDQTGGGGGQGSSKQPKRNDPEPTTPTLGGPATDKQKKIFANAARTAESKLRQAGSPCASDFGADALKTSIAQALLWALALRPIRTEIRPPFRTLKYMHRRT
jgi:RHS repeat-associated protein